MAYHNEIMEIIETILLNVAHLDLLLADTRQDDTAHHTDIDKITGSLEAILLNIVRLDPLDTQQDNMVRNDKIANIRQNNAQNDVPHLSFPCSDASSPRGSLSLHPDALLSVSLSQAGGRQTLYDSDYTDDESVVSSRNQSSVDAEHDRSQHISEDGMSMISNEHDTGTNNDNSGAEIEEAGLATEMNGWTTIKSLGCGTETEAAATKFVQLHPHAEPFIQRLFEHALLPQSSNRQDSCLVLDEDKDNKWTWPRDGYHLTDWHVAAIVKADIPAHGPGKRSTLQLFNGYKGIPDKRTDGIA
ncbi:hypothetical protein MMC20_003952 [Loxospora ochrophaea]|nr:hypothetical protein [Loxospora ochrophaea]